MAAAPLARPIPRRLGIGALIVLLAGTSCSDDKNPVALPTDPETASPETAAYLTALPAWDTFSPTLPDTNDISGRAATSSEIVSGVRYSCTSTPYTISRTPEKIVTMDPDVNILWLGALLQGRGYKQGIGSLAEWSVRERAPLQIAIDLLDGRSTQVVVNPNMASVNQAIGSIVQAAEAAGHVGGSSLSYAMEQAHSVFQVGATLGLSTKYFGPQINATLAAGRNATETTLTAYFVQRMFTASIVLPNTPSDMFSEAFTSQRLQEERDRGHVGSDNVPVYVASIVFGRSLLFSFTSTSTRDSIRAALSAKVGKDSGSIDFRLLNILTTGRVGVVALGGDSRNATALIQSGQLADYFKDPTALTTARPISYTIRSLGNNTIAKVTETDSYNLKECDAIPSTGRVNIDVTPNDASVRVLGPGGYVFGPKTGDQLLTELTPGGYAIEVSRTGFDTSRVDISVAAGDALEESITLEDTNQTATGSIYTITPRRLHLDAVGCTGESQADIYHSATVNGKTLTNRPQSDAVPLYAGQFDEPAKGPAFWRTVRDTVWLTGTRKQMAFSVRMDDDDGSLNPPDPVAFSNWTYGALNIPVGLGLVRNTGGASGCTTRLQFDIVKEGEVFTAAP